MQDLEKVGNTAEGRRVYTVGCKFPIDRVTVTRQHRGLACHPSRQAASTCAKLLCVPPPSPTSYPNPWRPRTSAGACVSGENDVKRSCWSSRATWAAMWAARGRAASRLTHIARVRRTTTREAAMCAGAARLQGGVRLGIREVGQQP